MILKEIAEPPDALVLKDQLLFLVPGFEALGLLEARPVRRMLGDGIEAAVEVVGVLGECVRHFGVGYDLIAAHFVLESQLPVELLHLIEYLVVVVVLAEIVVEKGILPRIELVYLLLSQSQLAHSEQDVALVLVFVLLDHHLVVLPRHLRHLLVQLLQVLLGYLYSQLLELPLTLQGVDVEFLAARRRGEVLDEAEADEELHGPVFFIGFETFVADYQIFDNRLLDFLQVILATLRNHPLNEPEHISGLLNRIFLLKLYHFVSIVLQVSPEFLLEPLLLILSLPLPLPHPPHPPISLHLLLLLDGLEQLLLFFEVGALVGVGGQSGGGGGARGGGESTRGRLGEGFWGCIGGFVCSGTAMDLGVWGVLDVVLDLV